MATIRFTDNLQRHVSCPTGEVFGSTVKEALNAYFTTNSSARGYILDEQGSLRKHMVIFVNGSQISDRESLSDNLNDTSVIDVMQALSGG